MDYIVRKAPLSMGFSRQEYWSGLPSLLQGIFLIQILQVDSLLSEPPGKTILCDMPVQVFYPFLILDDFFFFDL